jgi:hypothetical protein
MKKPLLLLLMVALFFLPVAVQAVTYSFPEKTPLHVQEEAVMTVGTNLYLFHSGSEAAKNTINVNDVLTVYREYPPDFLHESREVGKVRVLSPLGDYYFDGEVIRGEVKAGDLAIKGTVACYVTPFKNHGHKL